MRPTRCGGGSAGAAVAHAPTPRRRPWHCRIAQEGPRRLKLAGGSFAVVDGEAGRVAERRELSSRCGTGPSSCSTRRRALGVAGSPRGRGGRPLLVAARRPSPWPWSAEWAVVGHRRPGVARGPRAKPLGEELRKSDGRPWPRRAPPRRLPPSPGHGHDGGARFLGRVVARRVTPPLDRRRPWPSSGSASVAAAVVDDADAAAQLAQQQHSSAARAAPAMPALDQLMQGARRYRELDQLAATGRRRPVADGYDFDASSARPSASRITCAHLGNIGHGWGHAAARASERRSVVGLCLHARQLQRGASPITARRNGRSHRRRGSSRHTSPAYGTPACCTPPPPPQEQLPTPP